MCGRFILIDWDGIEQRFQLADSDMRLVYERLAETGREPGPRYNIAPTQEVLAVRHDGERNRPELMRWGLVPSWAKDPKIGNRMINARAETLADRPSFRTAFRRRRCLVVADGFYEWTGEGKLRAPLRITLKSEGLFAFAGLWEAWKQPDDAWLVSCAIVTTQPNEFMSPIHNRMPVILSADAEATWLDPDLQDTDALNEILVPYSSESLTAYEVSRVVNSPANDGPGCILPVSRLI